MDQPNVRAIPALASNPQDTTQIALAVAKADLSITAMIELLKQKPGLKGLGIALEFVIT